MTPFVRVRRTRRGLHRPGPVDADKHAEGALAPQVGSATASNSKFDAERPLAAQRPLRLACARPSLRAAFRPESFGLGADCTDTQLSDALDQSWLAARGYAISGVDAGLTGDEGGDECRAPQRVKVAIPGRIDPKDEARFECAFEQAAAQLPPTHSQAHLDACAYQAWCQCFGPPVALTARDEVWASVPAWCWADEPFCEAFAALFEALPENCTNEQLAAALDEAWEESQGDNWQ